MSDNATASGTMTVNIPKPQNPWARISEIAAKVGVGPCEHGHPATITAMGADGKAYDVWSVISAVVDLMNAKVKS